MLVLKRWKNKYRNRINVEKLPRYTSTQYSKQIHRFLRPISVQWKHRRKQIGKSLVSKLFPVANFIYTTH